MKLKSNAVNDPLVKAQRKAFRESHVGKLEALMSEESRWKRKHTIASNKLAEVREQINRMAKANAMELSGVKPEVIALMMGGGR